MTEPIRNHLKVLGETTSAGGFYQNVNITGECKFNGDVDCEKLRLTGRSQNRRKSKSERYEDNGRLCR
jgi:hypothetical protein